MLVELEDVYNRYLKKGNPREYNRFKNFSRWVLDNYPDYWTEINSVDQWIKSQKEMTSKNGSKRGLKTVDIHYIINKFSTFGLPKCHTAAARFSECLRVWLAANWDIYGRILKESMKIKTHDGVQIITNLSEETVSYIYSKTGIQIGHTSTSSIHVSPKSQSSNQLESDGAYLEILSIRNLLNYPILCW